MRSLLNVGLIFGVIVFSLVSVSAWSEEDSDYPKLVAPESIDDPIQPEDGVGFDSVGVPDLSEVEPGEDDFYEGGSEDAYNDVESITITGKAGKVWDDVPDSTIGFTALELDQERVADISDLSNIAPNLQISQAFAASNPVLFIRGVGLDDFNANSSSAVAIYQDGVYMNSPAGQLFQFFDVANVEVLRGPQAGRYRNASAGAILVESQAPTPDFNTYASFTYGNYNRVEGEGALNVPIIEDRLWARFSGKFTFRDGWTKNRCGGAFRTAWNAPDPQCVYPKSVVTSAGRPGGSPSGYVNNPNFSLGANEPIYDPVNNARNWAGRAQFLLDVPLEAGTMDWLLNVHGGQNLGLAAQFQQRAFNRLPGDPASALGPSAPYAQYNPRTGDPYTDRSGYVDTDGDPFAGDYNNGGYERLDLIGANLRGFWSVADDLEIVSLTGYEWHDRNTLENTDANPFDLLVTLYTDNAWQFSEELRVDSYWTDTLESSFGGFFFMEKLNVSNQFEDASGASPNILIQTYSQDTLSFSFFGEFSWNLLERLTFEGDIRYTHEFKEMDNFSTAINPFVGLTDAAYNVANETIVFSGLSGMASLTWDVTDESSVYLKYTRGWKPGHFNGGAVYSKILIEPVRPEKLNSYEIGGRISLLDGMLNVNGAVFYYDYQDLQIFALEQDGNAYPLPQLINAQGATIFGAELGFNAEPIDGLTIRYDVAFLETEYSEFTNTINRFIRDPNSGQTTFVDATLDYTGNRMIGSPAFSMSGAIQYTLPLILSEGRDWGELVPRFSFSWKDSVYFDPGEGTGPRLNLPAGTTENAPYALLNASLAWRSPNGIFEVTGWVRNIENRYYKVQSFDITESFNFVLDAYGAPRTFGFTVGAYF